MKVRIDRETCVGCVTCVDICPEIFEMDDEFAIVKTEDVPEEFQESCREAAETCGVEAIIIEE